MLQKTKKCFNSWQQYTTYDRPKSKVEIADISFSAISVFPQLTSHFHTLGCFPRRKCPIVDLSRPNCTDDQTRDRSWASGNTNASWNDSIDFEIVSGFKALLDVLSYLPKLFKSYTSIYVYLSIKLTRIFMYLSIEQNYHF